MMGDMTMKLEKKISLHAFEVEYIDQREAKPRSLHRESIVLDGSRMNTLDYLNQTPQSWIRQQYAQQGYTVAAIHKGESLTAKVDTGFLWKLAALDEQDVFYHAKRGLSTVFLKIGFVNRFFEFFRFFF